MTTVTRYTGVTATGTGPKLAFLKNLMNNPRAALALTGITAAAGTGGAGAVTRLTTGGPLAEAPSFARLTWSTAPSANTGAQLYNGLVGKNLATPGKIIVGRVYVRASWAATIQPKFGYWLGSTYVGGVNGTAVALTPNVWTPLSLEGTIPAGVDRIQFNTDPTTAAVPSTGSTLDATAWFAFEKPAGSTVDTTAYGDGDMGGWAWLGTAHDSASQGYGAIS